MIYHIDFKKKIVSFSCFLFFFCLSAFADSASIVQYLRHPNGASLQTFKSEKVIVDDIIMLQNKNGGSTYSIRWGDLEKKELYVVSLYPDLGEVIEGKHVGKEKLRQFVEKNIKLLLDPRCTVGTWYDSQSQKTYLDVSAVFFDKEEAVELAKKYNQIAIYDLGHNQQINTGGNGKTIKDMPGVYQRLPALK